MVHINIMHKTRIQSPTSTIFVLSLSTKTSTMKISPGLLSLSQGRAGEYDR